MFPFDYPAATAAYLSWYLVTLVLHVLPMNYVLAGSTYLACYGVWEAIFGPSERQRPIAGLLRDWMPFALGVTITAGVAPLLFLQILYRREFYTANLLLFNRWMAILPVLIVAFYLLYLQKSKLWASRPAAIRAGVSVGIVVCFAFVAWSWTENHLLSLQDQAEWSTQYVGGRWFYFRAELMPRLTVWYVGAFPAVALTVGGQLLLARRGDPSAGPARTLALLAVSGMIGAGIAAGVYFSLLSEAVRSRLLQPDAVGFGLAAAGGAAVETAAWLGVWRTGRLTVRTWSIAAVGLVVATFFATLLREVRRTASIDVVRDAERHATAAQVGGLGTFLLFFVINSLIIVVLIVMIRRSLRPADVAE
jgi:hypothetical protein